jgi:rhamnosyltransferase subunit B
MTQFLITAIGSHGDVHPMVGLGACLASRGHDVKIITNPYFADVVSSAGLTMLPVGTVDEYLSISQHPDLWHAVKGTRLIMKRVAGGLLRRLYEVLRSQFIAGSTVLCAHGLDLASRVAGNRLGAPVASIDFAPSMYWSLHDSPRLKGMPFGSRAPRIVKRIQFWATDVLFIKSLLDVELNGLRRELGLQPVTRVFSRWLHDTNLVLGLFPDWFGPPQPDWPSNLRLVGFPLWDTPAATGLSEEIQAFLAAGTPPIAFSPGSANTADREFFAEAVAACVLSGRRGILLTQHAGQLPPNLPPNVRHFGFIPLSKLLPHTAALVHHGGIGNCAQGLTAGVPHLVRPMAFDQFDNARRLTRLGVGEELTRRQFRGPIIAASLERLLSSAQVAENRRTLAAKCHRAAAFDAACDALEELATRRVTA